MKKTEYYEHEAIRTEQLRLADRLSRLLSSSSSITELCEGVAGELRKLMPLDWAAIALSDEANATVRLSSLSRHISYAWELGETIPLPGSPVAHLIEDKKTVMEPDLEQASRFATGVSFLKEGIKSVVYVPLFSARIVFGGLIVGSRRANAYGDRELRLLWFTGAQIALPIENEKLRREMAEKAERMAAIRKLARLISAGDDAEKLVEQFGRQLKDIVPLDYVSISRVEGRQAETLGVYEATPTRVTEELTFPLNDTPLGWLATNKKPFVTPDLRIETGFPFQELFVKAGLRSGIFLPLFSGEEVIGSLQVCSSQPDAYGKKEQQFLEELAAEIAIPVKCICLRSLTRQDKALVQAVVNELTTRLNSIIDSADRISLQLAEGNETAELISRSAVSMNISLSKLRDLAEGDMIGNIEQKVEVTEVPPISSEVRASSTMDKSGIAQAYCVKCRKKVEIRDPRTVVLKNKVLAVTGTCPISSNIVYRFVERHMEPTNALEMAMEREKAAMQFYAEAANRTQDPDGKHMFNWLAREEGVHLAGLERQLKSIKDTKAWEKWEETSPPITVKDIEQATETAHTRTATSCQYVTRGEVSALRTAMRSEQKAVNFYQKCKEVMTDEVGRDRFDSLVKKEQGHLKLLERAMELVTTQKRYPSLPRFLV